MGGPVAATRDVVANLIKSVVEDGATLFTEPIKAKT
jgi:hypothetical protein